MDLAFLPATAPGDETYGSVTKQIPGYPDVLVRQVHYPSLVWYNEPVREQAIAQIHGWGVAPVVLVGFSKSGLGAWNIARTIPDRISATIIFDAPVARRQMHPAGAAAFYPDDAAWQADLPLCTIHEFGAAMPTAHRLVLISGEEFHQEMSVLSQSLRDAGLDHAFLAQPDMRHHWNSGWIEKALKELLEPSVPGDA
jgi:pimeloyl-ACP methyl ester carboxylesterase